MLLTYSPQPHTIMLLNYPPQPQTNVTHLLTSTEPHTNVTQLLQTKAGQVHLGTRDPCRLHATARWVCPLRSSIKLLSSSSSSYSPYLSHILMLLNYPPQPHTNALNYSPPLTDILMLLNNSPEPHTNVTQLLTSRMRASMISALARRRWGCLTSAASTTCDRYVSLHSDCFTGHGANRPARLHHLAEVRWDRMG